MYTLNLDKQYDLLVMYCKIYIYIYIYIQNQCFTGSHKIKNIDLDP